MSVHVSRKTGLVIPIAKFWIFDASHLLPRAVTLLCLLDGVLHHLGSLLSCTCGPWHNNAVPLCPQITSTALQNLQRSRPPQHLLWMWVRPCCLEPGPAPRARGRGTSQSATWSSAPAWSHLRRRKRRVRLSTAMGWPSRQVLLTEREEYLCLCFDVFCTQFPSSCD